MDPDFPSVGVDLPATEGRVRVRVLRTVAAVIGQELALSSSAIDDLRIAVDELGMALVLPGDGDPVHVRLGVDDGPLVVHGRTSGDFSGWSGPSFDLSRHVVVAPDHELRARAGGIEFVLHANAAMPARVAR